jgi:hypothetical protein
VPDEPRAVPIVGRLRVQEPIVDELDHLSQVGWLRSVEVVSPICVGHKSNAMNKIDEIADHAGGSAQHTRSQEALDYPIGVPVVQFTKPTTRHKKGMLHRNQGMTKRVVEHVRCAFAAQRRPLCMNLIVISETGHFKQSCLFGPGSIF